MTIFALHQEVNFIPQLPSPKPETLSYGWNITFLYFLFFLILFNFGMKVRIEMIFDEDIC